MFSGWYGIKDGDARAYALFRKHYSFYNYKDNRRSIDMRARRIVGPGERLVLLLAPWCNALFVWHKFEDPSGQIGVNCSVFRNESGILSSQLILEAEEIAWQKWPGERLYTYVGPGIKSTNPGYCFLMAGWHRLKEKTGSGKVILEKLPSTDREALLQLAR